LTWPAVRRRRLARHQLSRPSGAGIAAVAGAIGTVHAQMQHAAELALALRCADVTRADVQRALWHDRTLVRTYGVRGTIHLIPATELDLWLTALRALPAPRQPTDPAQQLGPAKMVQLVDAIGEAIASADPSVGLDRDALGKLVLPQVGAWAREATVPMFGGLAPAWTCGIGAAAAEGRLVLGRAARHRTAYLHRPGAPQDVDPDGAVAEVVRRFLHVYGPATQQDLVRWFRTTPAAAKAALDRAEAVPAKVEGTVAWVLDGDDVAGADDDIAAGVHLLGHFDAFLVGSRPREQLVPSQHATRLLRTGASGPVPAVVIDGVASGVWTHAESGAREQVTVEPFGRLTRSQRDGLAAAVRRVGRALGREAELTVGPVEVRPHL
jgi:hypothetical protein